MSMTMDIGSRPYAHARCERAMRGFVSFHAAPGPVAVVAHDARGPLANLSLVLESLAADPAFVPQILGNKINQAMQLVARMDQILSSHVEQARRQQDARVPDHRPVVLHEVMAGAIDLNRPMANRYGLRLVTKGGTGLVVAGDRAALTRVLENLVSNAIKHSPDGGSIVVRAWRQGQKAVLRVTDDGPGFTADDLDRAFRPFTRLSATSSRPMPSTGLGLSIVKSIVESHGGSVTAATRRGRSGAVLTVVLPLYR